MDWTLASRLMLFALPLSLDNFAVSLALGVTPMPAQSRLRLAVIFAAAEGLMPAVGLLLGLPLGSAIGAAGTYVGGGLILALGLWLWLKGLRADDDEETERVARAASGTGWAVIGIALSISLDELAVGFSFGVVRLPVVPALLTIAAQALVVSLIGQGIGRRVGAKVGERIGERAERLAGPALCLLGLWFILARVFGLPA